MVFRPCGSLLVATTPRGLLKTRVRHPDRLRRSPSTTIRARSGSTSTEGSRTIRPFTRTRPERIASVACERDRMPSLESARLIGTRPATSFCRHELRQLVRRAEINRAVAARGDDADRADHILEERFGERDSSGIARVEMNPPDVAAFRRRQ